VLEDGTDLLNMATGESVANLNYLEGLGQIRHTIDADGVAWFQQV